MRKPWCECRSLCDLNFGVLLCATLRLQVPLARPSYVELDTLVPLSALCTLCASGYGMAVCPTLGLVVTSDSHKSNLSVFHLSSTSKDAELEAGTGTGLALACTLGGASAAAPMKFRFLDFSDSASGGHSGLLAFTGPPTARLLLVTDAGHDAVHVIDVVARVHKGYVAAPGTVAGPRGVAARGSLVAVSAWRHRDIGDHVVHVFEGSGCSWAPVRLLCGGFRGPGRADGQLKCPYGLRFTSDGSGLAVADWGNGRVSLLRISDGCFVRHLRYATGPHDVEECEGGWLVARFDETSTVAVHTVEFVDSVGDFRGALGEWGDRNGQFGWPSALALVPGLGLVVREWKNRRVQFFKQPSLGLPSRGLGTSDYDAVRFLSIGNMCPCLSTCLQS